tara:strand:+ start:37209 stop:37661 length:453 start_codon:yes stop_codon:yes gene_type:complete
MNDKNLLKLADYLENHVTQDQFNMEHFRSDHSGYCEAFRSLENCGTVGCALGWAPFASKDMEPVEDDFFSDPSINSLMWETYCKRVMGFKFESPNYMWCFAEEWGSSYIDNTPKGAALRIREMVKKGIPKNYYEQMTGMEEYMFREDIES